MAVEAFRSVTWSWLWSLTVAFSKGVWPESGLMRCEEDVNTFLCVRANSSAEEAALGRVVTFCLFTKITKAFLKSFDNFS